MQTTIRAWRLDLGSTLRELVTDGWLTQAQSNAVLGTARTKAEALMHPLAYIGSRGLKREGDQPAPITTENLLHWLAQKADLPVSQIDPLKINVPGVTSVMSYAFAKRHGILCIESTREKVVVAVTQPFENEWEEGLRHTTGREVVRVLADPEDVAKYQLEFYSLAKSVFGAGSKTYGASNTITNFEQLLEVGSLKDPDAQDQHIVNIVDWLLQYAFEQRASDIHIEPRREKGKIRFRIDGVLHQVYELPANVMTAMVSRIKILGRMDVAEKRRPQDGRVKTKTPNGMEVELRLSTMATAFGEKLVMRIFDPEVLLRSFAELGLTGEDYQRWQQMTDQKNGIVLVTGPTGSGKTTTLYSTLKQLAVEQVNVSTVEDPIEMVVGAFNQTQVQTSIGFDFASGIRTLMRQDPDIIMVGEIRDLETAEMAVQAALTGHLVLSTLHTNDAPTAITRLLDLGVPAHLIRVTLNGVLAQRLVRTLCPHCKTAETIDDPTWEALVKPWKMAKPEQVYEAVGCLECRNTGYIGRQGLYEMMPMRNTLMDLLSDDCDVRKLRIAAMKEGMKTLRLSGAAKIAEGLTTIEEVMRVTPELGR